MHDIIINYNYVDWRTSIGERMNSYLWKSRVYMFIYIIITVFQIAIQWTNIALNLISLSMTSDNILITLEAITFSLAVINGLILVFTFIVKPRSNTYKLEMCRRKYGLLFDELSFDAIRNNDSDHRDIFFLQREKIILSRQAKYKLIDDLLPRDSPITAWNN